MIPAEIATKLAKLISRLATEHDGEVIATVRAISRTLTAANLDWHAIAAAVEAPAPGPRSFEFSADDWDAAAKEAEAQAAARETARNAPDAPAREWGMKLWGSGTEHWSIVAQHSLMLDWTFPKAQGGRILTKDERERLKAWSRSARLTNADADWLRDVVDRLHAAAERADARRRNAA